MAVVDGHQPRRFDFGQPAVVQQPFTFDGKDYASGEAFPYEDLCLDKNRMRGFWLASYVDFVPAGSAAPAKPSKRR